MAFTVGTEQSSIFDRLKKMTPARRVEAFKSSQSDGAASPFTRLTPAEFAELFP